MMTTKKKTQAPTKLQELQSNDTESGKLFLQFAKDMQGLFVTKKNGRELFKWELFAIGCRELTDVRLLNVDVNIRGEVIDLIG